MDLRNFDLNLLLVFDALLQERSVTLAARRLNLSQPTVSASLKRLRDAFGDELFVKSTRGVEPTPLAKDLQEAVADVLAGVQQKILNRSGFDPATSSRQFVIIAGELGQMVFVHDLLDLVHARAPGVKIKFVFPTAEQRTASLEDGRADLALGYFPQLAGGNLFQQQLYSRPLVCVARMDHPQLHAGLTKELFARLDHLVVASLSNVNELVEGALRQEGLVRKIPVELAHASGATAILQRTELIAVVPSVLARIYCDREGLQAHAVPFALPLMEVKQFWHRTSNSDPAVTWLRGLIRDTYQGVRPQRES